MTDKDITTKNKQDLETRSYDFAIPPADIIEDDNAFTIELEMPGIEKSDVDINVEDDVLTVETHKDFSDKENVKCMSQEFVLENFKRSFTLNHSVDVDKINAKMENGILKLDLPKSEKLKPRKINVEAE
jgi:HSP20 family protein